MRKRRLVPLLCGLVVSAPVAAQSGGDQSTYTYDALGRLTQVAHNNGAATTYQYDAAGNRTHVTSSTPVDPSDPANAGKLIWGYSAWNSGNWSN